eukprot:Pgem_evm1s16224
MNGKYALIVYFAPWAKVGDLAGTFNKIPVKNRPTVGKTETLHWVPLLTIKRSLDQRHRILKLNDNNKNKKKVGKNGGESLDIGGDSGGGGGNGGGDDGDGGGDDDD